MQTSLWGIAKKAKQQKDYRFGDLYRLLDKNALYLAWKDINRKAAVGVDKETAKEFEKNLDVNLNELLDALKGKRYKAKLVRRVNIPKGEGKTRPLGIPTVSTNYPKGQLPFGKHNYYSPISPLVRAELYDS